MRILGGAAFAAMVAVGSLSAYAAQAQVVSSDLGKNLEFQQNTANSVAPAFGGVNAFIFGRNFYPNASDFDGGTMSFPGPASPQTFNISGLLDCCGDNGMGYQSGYMTQAALDANFPTGVTYALTSTNSVTLASQEVDVAYANDLYTSDIPQLTPGSFLDLHKANPGSPLTIDFNSFTPNGLADFGQGFFNIFDFTTATTVASFSGFSPSTTSLTLPAGTLTRGHSYVFELIFDDGVNGVDPNGVAVSARSDMRTFGDFAVGVPEPATWAMMLAGVGLAGAALRRRRTVGASRTC